MKDRAESTQFAGRSVAEQTRFAHVLQAGRVFLSSIAAGGRHSELLNHHTPPFLVGACPGMPHRDVLAMLVLNALLGWLVVGALTFHT